MAIWIGRMECGGDGSYGYFYVGGWPSRSIDWTKGLKDHPLI